MPSYQVNKPCFLDGKMYGPNTKRSVYVRDKPYKKKEMPSYMTLIEEVLIKGDKKVKADKVEADKVEVDSVTFMENEPAGQSLPEVL